MATALGARLLLRRNPQEAGLTLISEKLDGERVYVSPESGKRRAAAPWKSLDRPRNPKLQPVDLILPKKLSTLIRNPPVSAPITTKVV